MNANPSAKTALVTGASGGIGEAIAEQFAKDRIDLVIVARSAKQLEANAAKWRAQYGAAIAVIASDLAQAGAAQALADDVLGQGIAIDYLVNNAGYGSFGLFADSDLDYDVGMMRLNMETLTILSKRFLPGIIARRGKIMNVASTAAFQPGPYMAVYYATKAYVLSFSEAIAEELEGTGVTVTAFCPGPTASGFQDKAALHDSGLVKGRRMPGAEEVGIAGYRAMQRGQRVYIPGAMNWLLAQSIRYTPRRLVTKVVKRISRPV
ncbi:MAG TPA: SDR family oxidoreductase [Burkholderiales bacterium]|nr:SDR family oxidoreductase [Burkholderiales bacterium]